MVDGHVRRDHKLVPDWALLLFVFILSIFVIGIFAIQRGSEAKARGKILAELRALPPDYRVILNGRAAEDGHILIAAIERLQSVQPHHSHPMEPIRVLITSKSKTVNLVMARDSGRPDEYWVFQPGPNLQGDPRGQEGGRVVDPQLTEYLARRGF
jgi:hypothetical protein